jgi:hypothetical protein
MTAEQFTSSLERTVKRWNREKKMEGMKALLLFQMTLRFGRLSSNVRRKVCGIEEIEDLKKLASRVLVAADLKDLGL